MTLIVVFERIFLSRIMGVRSVLDAIPDHQFGFKHHHGTPEQAHPVVQHILNAFENKHYSSAIFPEAKKAFDRDWHDGLLHKLKYQLPTGLFYLLKLYVLDRSFMFEVRGERSSIRIVRVPFRISCLLQICRVLISRALFWLHTLTTLSFLRTPLAELKRQGSPRNFLTSTASEKTGEMYP